MRTPDATGTGSPTAWRSGSNFAAKTRPERPKIRYPFECQASVVAVSGERLGVFCRQVHELDLGEIGPNAGASGRLRARAFPSGVTRPNPETFPPVGHQ